VRNLLRLFNSVANSGVTCLEIVDSGVKLEIFSGSKLELIPDRVVFGFLHAVRLSRKNVPVSS
jgi:hypothetical protein